MPIKWRLSVTQLKPATYSPLEIASLIGWPVPISGGKDGESSLKFVYDDEAPAQRAASVIRDNTNGVHVTVEGFDTELPVPDAEDDD